MPSSAEELLALMLRAHRLPKPEREFRFDPVRRWRADFAWPVAKVLAEVDGGMWVQGRHNRGTGYQRDCEKTNAASLDGWLVLRFTPQMVENGDAITALKRALETRSLKQ